MHVASLASSDGVPGWLRPEAYGLARVLRPLPDIVLVGGPNVRSHLDSPSGELEFLEQVRTMSIRASENHEYKSK